ncbi:NADP-dependent oxidoreductase [Actinomycetospora termitidis]|uniref:NADP-dependent oxidoreductase n=1 Tax=Actinomycetospora termitidis TaxID=3053470 RepID=A0ABT7MCT9_9PSEU|nr:NADP-dependent oxidoreductase [Actinomycetospora sp. Odt1-22]MDL5158498.1 NADP-dependent oxidoreductase [Actinomycetospora sp. Odt1-22]
MRGYGFVAVGGPEQQAFLEVDEPVPGPGELLVAVRAAGVNPGDWKVRDGSYGTVGPAVLGREVAGTVLALGPDVTGFAEGDEVFGGCPDMQGGWAPRARVTAGFAAHRPETVSAEDAAALPVAAGTAWDALEQLDLPSGSVLLVNGGGGGVGIPIIQLAVARGLRVVTTASPGKHAMLSGYGATPVAYGDGVLDRLREVAPDGVDGVFDLVGGDPLCTVAGLLSDPTKLISVADYGLSTELGGQQIVRDRSTAVLERLVGLVADGALDPHVTDVRPLDDAQAALALVEGGHATGKVILTVG